MLLVYLSVFFKSFCPLTLSSAMLAFGFPDGGCVSGCIRSIEQQLHGGRCVFIEQLMESGIVVSGQISVVRTVRKAFRLSVKLWTPLQYTDSAVSCL